MHTPQLPPATDRKGFTLVDLMAVVAIVCLLSSLAIPALGTSRERAADAICLANLRALANATHLYAASFNGWLPPNSDGAAMNWVGMSNETDPNISTNLAHAGQSLLAPYLRGNVRVFKCPADTRTVLTPKFALSLARNYSLNGAVGTNPNGGSKATVDGPWLDGVHGHLANQTYRCYGRVSDMGTPSSLYWFVDEGNDSINDGAFAAVGPGIARAPLIDWPAERHNTGAGFAFGDAHAEIHRWTRPGISGDGFRTSGVTPVAAPLDQAWISDHTSVKIDR